MFSPLSAIAARASTAAFAFITLGSSPLMRISLPLLSMTTPYCLCNMFRFSSNLPKRAIILSIEETFTIASATLPPPIKNKYSIYIISQLL